MYIATGSRITVAIGALAICLAAISPAGTWAAEPVKQEKKQEKKAKKPAQAQTSAPAPKATATKFASAETAGKAPILFRGSTKARQAHARRRKSRRQSHHHRNQLRRGRLFTRRLLRPGSSSSV